MIGIERGLLDKIRKKNKTIHFNITNQCNMRCRHCINIGSKTVLGEVEEEKLLQWLTKVKGLGYKKINIVGGEPFLKREMLRIVIDKATEQGLLPGVTTNAYWADTMEEAEKVVSELHGMKQLLISTDFFHMEHIPLVNIRNAVSACRKNSIFTAVNAVCCTKQEADYLQKLLQELPKEVFVNINILMPYGAAAKLSELVEREFSPEDTDNIPDFCDVEEHYVDSQGDIFTCCMSTLCTDTKQLRLGNLQTDEVDMILRKKETNSVYALISNKGIKGLVEALSKCEHAGPYLQKIYSSQCEFCVTVLNDLLVVNELEKVLRT